MSRIQEYKDKVASGVQLTTEEEKHFKQLQRTLDPALDNQIYDLMEEYGQDNDLPECWWMSEIDEDEILFNL